MTWQRRRDRSQDGDGRRLWTVADQHRFEDQRIRPLEDDVDTLQTRQAWVAAGLAMLLVLLSLGLAVARLFLGGG